MKQNKSDEPHYAAGTARLVGVIAALLALGVGAAVCGVAALVVGAIR